MNGRVEFPESWENTVVLERFAGEVGGIATSMLNKLLSGFPGANSRMI
jgi:hypothetical protein